MGAMGWVLGCAELVGTDELVGTGELVEDPAAEVTSLGPHAVSASPAATITAVDKPQRAVLVRMVSLFRFRRCRPASGGDESDPAPGRKQPPAAATTLAWTTAQASACYNPVAQRQTRQNNRHRSIANTCECRWVQIF
jgi:hypothetical protein